MAYSTPGDSFRGKTVHSLQNIILYGRFKKKQKKTITLLFWAFAD